MLVFVIGIVAIQGDRLGAVLVIGIVAIHGDRLG